MSETLVTYFPSPRSNIALTVSLDKVLSDFTNGAYSSHVLRVRKILKQDGSDAYKEAKKSLPAIAFCGEFYGGHAKSNLIKYNNLVVFDIDHLTDDEMKHTYDQLVSENIVMAFWVSPSGNGYKGLLRVKFNNIPKSAVLDDCYKKAYADAIAYFMHKYGIQLDSSCSDYSRMCYVCSDNHLFYRENAEIFNIDCRELMVSGNKSGLSKNRLDGIQNSVKSNVFKQVNIKGKNASRSRRTITSIIKYLSKRKLSITYTYDEWLRVGFAIANTFNYDLGLKYYLELCKLDKEKYDEAKCIEKLQECYTHGSGDVTFGTIVDMAKNKGFIIKGSSEDL